MPVLSERIVNQAAEFLTGTLDSIVAKSSAIAQQSDIQIAVGGNGLEQPILLNIHRSTLFTPFERNRSDFDELLGSLKLALRTGKVASVAADRNPHSLREGENFLHGTAAEDTDLAVAVRIKDHGLSRDHEETMAWLIWNVIWLLCKLQMMKEAS